MIEARALVEQLQNGWNAERFAPSRCTDKIVQDEWVENTGG